MSADQVKVRRTPFAIAREQQHGMAIEVRELLCEAAYLK
jgi:hypothetical protein